MKNNTSRYLTAVFFALLTVMATTFLQPAAHAYPSPAGAPYMQQVLDSWIGEHYADLSRNWGTPTSWFYTRDGRKMLIFTLNNFQIQSYRATCIRKILVNYDETILDGFWEGNCDPATAFLGDTSSWPNYKRFGYNPSAIVGNPPSGSVFSTTHH
jgi:hypothetical protein